MPLGPACPLPSCPLPSWQQVQFSQISPLEGEVVPRAYFSLSSSSAILTDTNFGAEPVSLPCTILSCRRTSNLVPLGYLLPQGGSPAAYPSHIKIVSPHCCSLYRGMTVVVLRCTVTAFLPHPIMIYIALNPQTPWMHKMFCSRMSSLVIPPTNTQVRSGHHPRVSSIKTERVSRDATHRMSGCVSPLAGHLAWQWSQGMTCPLSRPCHLGCHHLLADMLKVK
jgi:hypothetical protein